MADSNENPTMSISSASPAAAGSRPAPTAADVGAVTPADVNRVQCQEPTLDGHVVGGSQTVFYREFGDYELLGEVARGGMGVVFKARQKSLNRIVALKMILAGHLASPEQVRRFHTEAEEAGRLDHPNIVPVYEVGERGGQHFFSMKLIEGGPLTAVVDRLKADPIAAARLMAVIARAVHHAHQRGILHRDLKPGNILIDADGQPHVTDFGLAKHLGADAGTVTQSGAVMGTPSYMSPEQAGGKKDLSTAADVYSLGAVLYELLTGRPPFQAKSVLDVLMKVVDCEAPPPHAVNPTVPRDLETICLKCLEKDPHQRYDSAEALARDLDRYLAGEPIRARPVSVAERAAKWARRRPAAAALMAVSLLAGFGFLATGWYHNIQLRAALGDAEERRQEAEKQRAEAERQQRLVEASRDKHRDTLQKMVTNLDGRLENYRGLESVRHEFLAEFLEMCQSLPDEHKADPDLRRQTAEVHRRLGDIFKNDREEPRRSLEQYEAAIALLEGLAAEIPENVGYRNELGFLHARRASALHNLKEYPAARTAYDKAIDVLDRLAADAPGDPLPSRRASVYRFEQATVFDDAGRDADAQTACADALARQEKLTAAYPKDADQYHNVAMTLQKLAALKKPADAAAAQALLARAVAADRKARELAPANREYATRLRQSYRDFVEFLRQRQGHADLARLAEDYRTAFPDDGGETYNAACMTANALDAVLKAPGLGDAERERQADAYAGAAVELLRKAALLGYRDRDVMDADDDLDPLRKRAEYVALMSEFDKIIPATPPTASREFQRLQSRYFAIRQRYEAEERRARTPAEKMMVLASRPDYRALLKQHVDVAAKYKDSANALAVLIWVLESTAELEGEAAQLLKPVRQQALAALERDHFQKNEMADVCKSLGKADAPEILDLLRGAAERHAREDVRGLAAFSLAEGLIRQADKARKKNPSSAAELEKEAEQQLTLVREKYATVAYGRSTLGKAADARLFALRSLMIGRAAPEIQGNDLDGKSFKLSDYRGKVVVLDFWANWCGFCRQFYPQQKELARRHANAPFAIVGVNCDDDRDDMKRVLQREKLPGRSFWDGGTSGGRVRENWQVEGFPTVFVLDHKGVIRHRNLRGAELDAAVDKLVAEARAGK